MVVAVSVRDLGKRFRRYHADRPATLQEALVRGLRRIAPEDSFWALRHVSFDLSHGEMLGVIGANGAGKSTLLRLLAGVSKADEGSIAERGRVGGLLELGAGFHPDLTGRENVFVNGIIGGLTRKQVQQRFDSIISFAELDEFVDGPLRTYSTGMRMRLAFAVAIHTEPQILLVDEVLAVGDAAFQHKCLNRIAQLKSQGSAILVVSHDLSMIQSMCDTALWLQAGHIVARGRAPDVVNSYQQDICKDSP